MTNTMTAAAASTAPVAHQPSISELLAIFDNTKRHASAFGKKPMRRTSLSLLPVKVAAFVYFNEDDRLCLAHNDASRLDVEFFAAAKFQKRLESAMELGESIVFSERRAFGYASKAIDYAIQDAKRKTPADSWPFMSDLRQMKLAASMRSRTLPVLADILNDQFWLANGVDGSQIAEWTTAFNLTGSIPDRIQQLIGFAAEGELTNTSRSLQREATNAETSAMKSARYSGLSSQCAQFKRVEECTSADKALTCLDPKMLERNSINGDVCKIHIVSVKEGTFTAQVSAPFKLKPNSDVYLLDASGKHTVASRLIKLSVGADEMLAIFRMPSSGADRAFVTDAHNAYQSIFATPQPFMGGRGYGKTKWAASGPDAIDKITREVPLDVILAGAKTVD